MGSGPKVPLALLAESRAVGPSHLSPEEQRSRNKGPSELVIPLHTVLGQCQRYPRQGPRGGVALWEGRARPSGSPGLRVWLHCNTGCSSIGSNKPGAEVCANCGWHLPYSPHPSSLSCFLSGSHSFVGCLPLLVFDFFLEHWCLSVQSQLWLILPLSFKSPPAVDGPWDTQFLPSKTEAPEGPHHPRVRG